MKKGKDLWWRINDRIILPLAFFFSLLYNAAAQSTKQTPGGTAQSESASFLGKANAQPVIWFGFPQLNNWFFGRYAALTFGNGKAKASFLSKLTTEEGCAVASDGSGNLLFYTNGRFVYDRNHKQMEKGFGLQGHESSSQSVIVIKQPATSNMYYIFTVDASESQWENGLKFSIVDMDLAKGMGEVTQKNINLLSGAEEKLTGVLHDNGEDVWVCSYQPKRSTFSCFLLTQKGVKDQGVKSSSGVSLPNEPEVLEKLHDIGTMRFSPSQDMLAAAFQRKEVKLYPFNNSTGNVGQAKYTFPINGAYGVEFSPLGNYLYISTMEDYGKLFQIDLTDTVGGKTPEPFLLDSAIGSKGTLQLGPDGILYVARYNSKSLGAVVLPEQKGNQALYKQNYVSLGDGKCKLGLPQFTFTHTCYAPAIQLGQDTTLRANEALAINPMLSSSASFSWSDGHPSAERILTQAGRYVLSATRGECTAKDSVRVSYSNELNPELPPYEVVVNSMEEDFFTLESTQATLTVYSPDGEVLLDAFQFNGDWMPPSSWPPGVYAYSLQRKEADIIYGRFRLISEKP